MKQIHFLSALALAVLLTCTLGSCSGGSKSGGDDSLNGDSSVVVEQVVEKSKYGVDLGLSVNWADHNVGAEKPEDVGVRIPLGNVSGTIKAPSKVRSNISDTDQDIAKVKWGDGWRMPTGPEFQELFEECEWIKEPLNGHNGFRVVGPNGNSIFLPVTGDAYMAESTSQYDIVMPEKPSPTHTEGNYWFASRANDRYGCNHLTFNTDTGKVQMMIAQDYFIMSIRPVHD